MFVNFCRQRIGHLLGALLLSFGGSAACGTTTLEGVVIGLSDGDTVTVLDAAKRSHRVRLAGIDAPEKKQAFGDRSRQSLSELVFRQVVTVEYEKVDRYGRIVGKVKAGNLDANLVQVSRGMAWHYKAYELEQQPKDRLAYSRAEEAAREARQGLWRDPMPVAPWDFRRMR